MKVPKIETFAKHCYAIGLLAVVILLPYSENKMLDLFWKAVINGFPNLHNFPVSYMYPK